MGFSCPVHSRGWFCSVVWFCALWSVSYIIWFCILYSLFGPFHRVVPFLVEFSSLGLFSCWGCSVLRLRVHFTWLFWRISSPGPRHRVFLLPSCYLSSLPCLHVFFTGRVLVSCLLVHFTGFFVPFRGGHFTALVMFPVGAFVCFCFVFRLSPGPFHRAFCPVS